MELGWYFLTHGASIVDRVGELFIKVLVRITPENNVSTARFIKLEMNSDLKGVVG